MFFLERISSGLMLTEAQERRAGSEQQEEEAESFSTAPDTAVSRERTPARCFMTRESGMKQGATDGAFIVVGFRRGMTTSGGTSS